MYREHLRRRGKGVDEGFAVHVLAHGQAVNREDGGADIEQAGAVDAFIRFYVRAAQDKDSVGPVLDGRAGRFIGQVSRPQVVGMKAVIRDQHDVSVFGNQLHEHAQVHVVQLVGGFNDLVVLVIVLFRNPIQAGWVIAHEAVAEVVDGVEINGPEMPRLVVQHGAHGIPNSDRLRYGLGERFDALVLLLIDFEKVRHEQLHEPRIEVLGVGSQLLQIR